jgi:hypothetical protein
MTDDDRVRDYLDLARDLRTCTCPSVRELVTRYFEREPPACPVHNPKDGPLGSHKELALNSPGITKVVGACLRGVGTADPRTPIDDTTPTTTEGDPQ